MSKYHIHPVTGTPDKCNAIHNCPFASQDEHYDSKKEARIAFEDTMKEKIFDSNQKSRKKNRYASILKKNIDEILGDFEHENKDIKNLLSIASDKMKSISDDQELLIVSAMYAAAAKRYRDRENDIELSYTCYYIVNNINALRNELINEHKSKKVIVEKFELNCEESTRYFKDNFEESCSSYKLSGAMLPSYLVLNEEAHELTIAIDEDTKEQTVREILSNNNSENVYFGRVKAIEMANNKIKENAYNLINELSENGEFAFPVSYEISTYWEKEDDTEFKLLSGGKENNVYLHKPTMMVYKVPHQNSLIIEEDGNNTKSSKLKSFVIHQQEAYANVDEDKMKENDAEYCSTYFLTPKDEKGNEIPITVQPYLDPEVYVKYDLLDKTPKRYESDYQLTDVHSDNLFVNIKNGKTVFVDCLLPRYIVERL